MPQWLGTQQKRTLVPLSLNAQRRFMIWQMRGLSVSSPSIACKQYIESGVDYNIMLYRIHVLVIVQCQCDCCCLSSKDGTVIWESFGQLVASCLTILDMAVDDRCCPHSLVNLRSVRVDFVMWSLSIGHIWGLQFNRYICFSFRGNRPIFGWVPYLTLKIQGQVKLNCDIWGLEFNQYACFSFGGNRIIFGWDIANSIFDLENSRSRSRSRRKSTKI